MQAKDLEPIIGSKGQMDGFFAKPVLHNAILMLMTYLG